MQKVNILCVDDQREVLAVLDKDLDEFKSYLQVVYCESAEEAREILEEIDAKGDHLALIISDHVMPNQNGIDFLIELHNDPRFKRAKKMLLTGLATYQDTIVAINRANIDYYVAKPWQKGQLVQAIKMLITLYLVDVGLDYQPFTEVLDAPTLYQALRETEA